MKKLIAFSLIVCSLLLCSCSNYVTSVTDSRSFCNDFGDITVTTNKDDNVSIRTYTYTYNDLQTACVEMYRVNGIRSSSFEYYLGDNTVIRVATPEEGFKEYSLSDVIPKSSCYYIDSDNYHYWIYMPKTYKLLDNHSLEYLSQSDGTLKVYSDYFVIDTQNVGLQQVSDFMIVESSEPIFDWGKEDQKVENFMKNYNLDGDGHWCYDGYYFKTEESYDPYGENVYYFCVDSYIIKSFIAGIRYNGCKIILPAMIDTMLQHQNDEGFIPTYSLSTWLQEDYKIDAGFYDTRFNTDFWQYVLNYYQEMGGDSFYEALEKYSNFYLSYSSNNQIETDNGYFVADYYNPKGGELTHASLNHNIAEAELCMNLADFFGDSSYQIVANKILKAIEDTADQWIMDDNNLEYAICPDKSFAFEDYPYLTYNDLYDIQKMLQDKGLQRNASLEKLMNAKRKWMDRQGITEYKK